MAKPVSYNPNVPVVTSAGGTTVAYKDPNSPESILRKTAALNAQANVDTQFDNTTPAYATAGSDVTKEGFSDGCYRWIVTRTWSMFLAFSICLVLLAALLNKEKGSGTPALVLILLTLLAARLWGCNGRR